MTSSNRILVFDTTLRDGEQSPGVSLNPKEKLEIAQQLNRLGVDIIEAGFPAASLGDAQAVKDISRTVEGPIITALARTHHQDITLAWEAVKDASRPRIHTFISTSDIHIDYQLKTTREDVKGQTKAAVAQAKAYLNDVQFSPMDATRADLEFTAEVIAIALAEGATTINIPDTVGYIMPHEYAKYITDLYKLLPALQDVTVSVHCHNDLGLAVANSLAGVIAGARQVECAINGIGERAGNAALEEFCMLLKTRHNELGYDTNINSKEIARTSRLISRLTGYTIQPNKAIVGQNAFSHESGIHQDGVIKEPSTYEIMNPTDIGLESNSLVLGKHSGRHALAQALETMGYNVKGQALNAAFIRFKELADRKKQVTAMDLEALVTDELRHETNHYALVDFQVLTSARNKPLAQVTVQAPDKTIYEGTAHGGNGPIDAIFSALGDAVQKSTSKKLEPHLQDFTISALTEGEDALGQVSVVVDIDKKLGAGQAISTDIIEAAAKAYLRALSVSLSK